MFNWMENDKIIREWKRKCFWM